MKKLNKCEINIIEHLVLYPNSLLTARSGRWFVHSLGWFNTNQDLFARNTCDCDCPLCNDRGCVIANSFLKSLVKKDLLKRARHKKQYINGNTSYKVQWTLNTDKMSLYPELKELEVQYALGVGK